MYKLIKPINPFGVGCTPITEADEATKEWLIETGKAVESDFEPAENSNKKEKK